MPSNGVGAHRETLGETRARRDREIAETISTAIPREPGQVKMVCVKAELVDAAAEVHRSPPAHPPSGSDRG
jgi:hypothetical protein